MRVEDRSTQIAEMRREMGLTQRELAEHLGCAPPTISQWERGAQSPQPYRWKRLLALYRQYRERAPRDETVETTHL